MPSGDILIKKILSVHMLKDFNINPEVKPLSNRARFLALGISPEGEMVLKGFFFLIKTSRRLKTPGGVSH